MPHFCSLNPLHSLLGMLSLYFWMFSLMVHVHTCQLTCFNKKEAAFLACFKQLMFFISRISSYGTSHYSIFYNCKHAIVLDRPQKATGYINIWCIKLTSLQTRDIGRKWFCNRVYKFKNLTWSAQIESRSPEFRLIKKPNQILCAKWHFCCLFILFQFTNYTAVRTKTNTLNMQNKVSRCVCEYDVFFLWIVLISFLFSVRCCVFHHHRYPTMQLYRIWAHWRWNKSHISCKHTNNSINKTLAVYTQFLCRILLLKFIHTVQFIYLISIMEIIIFISWLRIIHIFALQNRTDEMKLTMFF